MLTSPRKRARDTCELAGLGARAEVTDDLAEWDYGDYEGRTTEQIRAEVPGWTIFSGGAPGGETAEQVAARADRVIARAQSCGGVVALFSHGHFLRVLGARWVGLPASAGTSPRPRHRDPELPRSRTGAARAAAVEWVTVNS